MPETVIVTVKYQGQEYDFELPSQVTVENWSESLLMTARAVFDGFLIQGRKAQFTSGGVRIQEDCTLEQCGIYDGSRIEVQLI